MWPIALRLTQTDFLGEPPYSVPMLPSLFLELPFQPSVACCVVTTVTSYSLMMARASLKSRRLRLLVGCSYPITLCRGADYSSQLLPYF